MKYYAMKASNEPIAQGPLRGHRSPYWIKMGITVLYDYNTVISMDKLNEAVLAHPGMVGLRSSDDLLIAITSDGEGVVLPLKIVFSPAMEELAPAAILRDMVDWFDEHDGRADDLGRLTFVARAQEFLERFRGEER